MRSEGWSAEPLRVEKQNGFEVSVATRTRRGLRPVSSRNWRGSRRTVSQARTVLVRRANSGGVGPARTGPTARSQVALASAIRLLHHRQRLSSDIAGPGVAGSGRSAEAGAGGNRLACRLWESEAKPQPASSVAILTELCFPACRFFNQPITLRHRQRIFLQVLEAERRGRLSNRGRNTPLRANPSESRHNRCCARKDTPSVW